MSQRLVPAILIFILLALHAQLWFGRGSLSHVGKMQVQLKALNIKTAQGQLSNAQLSAELSDLKEGLEMVEEKARIELGMVKPNEILVQYTK